MSSEYVRLEIPLEVARRVARRTGETPPGFRWREAPDDWFDGVELEREPSSALAKLGDILTRLYLPQIQAQLDAESIFLARIENAMVGAA